MSTFNRMFATALAAGTIALSGAVFTPVATAAPSYCSKPATQLTAAQRAVCDAAKSPASTSPRTSGTSTVPGVDSTSHLQLRQLESARNEARTILGIVVVFYAAVGIAVYSKFRRDDGLPFFNSSGGGSRNYTHVTAAAPVAQPVQPTTPIYQAPSEPTYAMPQEQTYEYPAYAEQPPAPQPQRPTAPPPSNNTFDDLI